MPIVVKRSTVEHEGQPNERRYDAYWWWCPGCAAERRDALPDGTPDPDDLGNGLHVFDDRWTFNGDFDKPTFRASYLTKSQWYRGPIDARERFDNVCHSFVTDGQIEYLTDSTHALAGQTVPIAEIPKGWLD